MSASIASKAFALYIGYCARLLLLTMRRAYDSHQEKVQMRFAPTEPSSWRDVRCAKVKSQLRVSLGHAATLLRRQPVA